MISMDYIISNADRHWQNFGVLRNAETLALISMAPIYDNGNSMFYRADYVQHRREIVREENTGIEKKELDRLALVHDRHAVDTDLIMSPKEVREFYASNGIPEERAETIAESYSRKLDIFLEWQHGIPVSVSREYEYIFHTPYIHQHPDLQYFKEHPEDICTESLADAIRQEEEREISFLRRISAGIKNCRKFEGSFKRDNPETATEYAMIAQRAENILSDETPSFDKIVENLEKLRSESELASIIFENVPVAGTKGRKEGKRQDIGSKKSNEPKTKETSHVEHRSR